MPSHARLAGGKAEVQRKFWPALGVLPREMINDFDPIFEWARDGRWRQCPPPTVRVTIERWPSFGEAETEPETESESGRRQGAPSGFHPKPLVLDIVDLTVIHTGILLEVDFSKPLTNFG